MMESKIKCFDGTGDIKVFIEKSQIHSSLKGYSGEKAAQNLASRLEGRAFDVYMHMDTEERKDPKRLRENYSKNSKGASRTGKQPLQN